MAIKNSPAPVAKYMDVKFGSNSLFAAWLKEKTDRVIKLKDNGQDLLRIYVDKEGEILYSNAQSSIWCGKFIQPTEKGANLVMYLPVKKGWTTMDFKVASIEQYTPISY